MGDPLSIISSAVGIVSLGLTVCQGLVSYYGPWIAYDQEISELAQKAEGLKATLHVVQATMQKPETTCTLQATDVQTNITSCRVVLQKLDKAIEKYKKTEPPSDFGNKLQSTAKRALYPFKRKTLVWLKNSVDGLQLNLNTTLQVLQLAMISHQNEQNEQVMSTAMATAAIANSIYERMNLLDAGLSAVCTTMATVQNDTSRAASGIDGSEQHLRNMSLTMARLQHKLTSKPTLLRTLCDAQSQVHDDSQWQLQLPAAKSRKYMVASRASCSCTRRLYTEEAIYRISSVSMFQLNSTSHGDGCPLHKVTEKTKTFGFKYAICNYLLRFSIEATLSMATGAGGITISPRLTLRNIVQEDAPAFQILRTLRFFIDRIDEGISKDCVSETVNNALKQLHELFASGKASPTDVTPSGNTPLFDACKLFYCRGTFNADTIQSCRHFLKGMIDAGFNVDERGIYGMAPLDFLIHLVSYFSNNYKNSLSIMAEICSDFTNAGATISEKAISSRPFPYDLLVKLGSQDDKYSTAFDMSDIVFALFTRSEKLLETAIEKYPTSIQARINALVTPIHLAVGWPYGLSMLLKAGAGINAYDSYQRLPIHHACILGCLSSVLMLIEAGSAIPSAFDYMSGNILSYAIQSCDQEIVRVIIDTLAQRRQLLQRTAEATLPTSVLDKLNLPHDRLLDIESVAVWETLNEYGIHVEYSLFPGTYMDSVYHTANLNVGDAIKLFEIGFHDVDSVNWANLTPLTQVESALYYGTKSIKESLALGNWLISKGASIRRNMGGVSFGQTMGKSFGELFGSTVDSRHRFSSEKEALRAVSHEHLSDLDIQYWALLIEILEGTTDDNCLCACSSDGCRMLTKIFKGLEEDIENHYRHRSPKTPDSKLIFYFLIGFSECLAPHLKENSNIPKEIIRFATFTELSLTHTCCTLYVDDKVRKEYIPQDEVEAIRAEECKTIDELEELVTLFEVKYDELGLPLYVFLTEFWLPKMDEFLTLESVLNKDVAEGARELGIVLEIS